MRVGMAMTEEAFKEYLRSQLGSTLKPGDIVICADLSVHKVAEMQSIIEAHGATIKYLQPRPESDQAVFSKRKALLRKTEESEPL